MVELLAQNCKMENGKFTVRQKEKKIQKLEKR
jgi:hypothetical protein